MKIAIIHDQLQEFGGAERVLVALKQIYPDADIFTSFFAPEKLGVHKELIKGWNVHTSWAQKIPLVAKLYSPLRFITPYIWETLDLSDYDVVISSSGSYMCKGVITRPETVHICYLHHPPRYLYYYETAREWKKHLLIRIYAYLVNHGLRIWDYLSSTRVDYFIANSQETKRRIEKFYRRDAAVIYPPVTVQKEYTETKQRGEYYITVSRLAKAKHIDVLIKIANEYKLPLKIVGKGRDAEYLKSLAGPTVTFLEDIKDDAFDALYANAKAFLFASRDEEFGISVVEALGRGVPVIAFASGGVPEIVKDGENGYLFSSYDTVDVYKKIQQLEALSDDDYQAMKKQAHHNAQQFSFQNFKNQIQEFVTAFAHARTARS